MSAQHTLSRPTNKIRAPGKTVTLVWLLQKGGQGAKDTTTWGKALPGCPGGAQKEEPLMRRILFASIAIAVAFSMYPTSIEQLMSIADAGEVMPPKSTWFEPKLRSGLIIHALD